MSDDFGSFLKKALRGHAITLLLIPTDSKKPLMLDLVDHATQIKDITNGQYLKDLEKGKQIMRNYVLKNKDSVLRCFANINSCELGYKSKMAWQGDSDFESLFKFNIPSEDLLRVTKQSKLIK